MSLRVAQPRWFTARVLTTLVARKSGSAVALVLVDEAGYPAFLKKQDRATKRWLVHHEFEPKGNRVLLLPGPKGPARAVFGRTEKGVFSWSSAAKKLHPGRYYIDPPLEPDDATDCAIGWALAAYRYDRYKSEPREAPRELVWPAGADRAEATRVVEVVGLVRDLINTPAEDLGPAELAAAVETVAGRYAAKVRIVRGKKLAEGYPMVHAVGRGSARPPLLIDLSWGDPSHRRLSLVGKGVCFDSGGLDLKPSAGMLRMKKDMGGAAHALGLAQLVMDRALPVRLRLLIPAVENLPGAHAFRPSDVLRSRKGTTVEVTNTDAEGRLVLADPLHEASMEKPDLLIDLATLTGSARVAVGAEVTPFFTKSAALSDELAKSARKTRDPVWRMPLHQGYRRQLDSHFADLKNAASSHLGGSITAALFLREFVEDPAAWLHLDIMGWNDHARAGRPIGGEATGLRAVWDLLKARYG